MELEESGKMTMTACSLWGIRDIRVEKVKIPRPERGQVVVKIFAAGICGSDIDRVYSKGTYHYPTILGHEFSGKVVETCDEDISWLGKRVAVFPLIPCMKCDSCKEGKYAQCQNYDYYGSRCDGAFAEFQKIKIWNLLPIPDDISYEEAAMLEPAATAVHALSLTGSLAGCSAVIFGIGTIALILAQILRKSGCINIILVARSQEKVDFARNLGFTSVINSEKEDVQKRIWDLTEQRGADLIIEGCGKSVTLQDGLLAAAPQGTIICLGNPAEDIRLCREAYWEILRKQLRLLGTWNSSYRVSRDDWKAALYMIESGILNLSSLITDRHSLDQAKEAFEELCPDTRQGVHVKSMFVRRENP